MRVWISATTALLAVSVYCSSALAVASRTPGSVLAHSSQPSEWEAGERDEAWLAPEDSGYVLAYFRQTTQPDLVRDHTVDLELDWLRRGEGYVHRTSHGSSLGFQVYTYPHTTDGQNKAQDDKDVYDVIYPGLTYVSEALTRANYGVSIRYSALADPNLPYRPILEHAFVMNDACSGGTTQAWTGFQNTGCAVMYGSTLEEFDFAESQHNVRAMCANLRGYLIDEYGVSRRTATNNLVDMTNTAEHVGVPNGQYLTLAPAPKRVTIDGFDWEPGQVVRTSGQVYYELDTEVNWSEDAFQLLETYMTGTVAILSNTVAIIDLDPIVLDERGPDGFWVVAEQVTSENCPDIYLAGNGTISPDSDSREFTYDYSPASLLNGCRVEDSLLYWEVEAEHETSHYNVFGRNSMQDPWDLIGSNSAGLGGHGLEVGLDYDQFMVQEVEIGGADGGRQYCGRVDVGTIERSTPLSEEEKIRWIPEENEAGPSPAMRSKMEGYRLGSKSCVAYYAPQFVAPVLEFEEFCESWLGMAVDLVDVESLHESGDTGMEWASRIKDDLRSRWETSEVDYAVLFGDAGEAEYLTAEYWPDPWDGTLDLLLSHGHDGNPENEHLPCFLATDPQPWWMSRTVWRPYFWLNDMIAYGDVINEDHYPEVYVGRIPLDTEEEMFSVIYVLMNMLMDGEMCSSPVVSVFLEDRDYPMGGPGTGVDAEGAMELITDDLGGCNAVLRKSERMCPECRGKVVWHDLRAYG